VRSDDYAVGFEVGDAVVGGVAESDGLAEHGDVAAGFFGEVTADGLVVVDDEDVRGFALGAVDGVFQPTVEGGGRKWADGVGSGFDGGDDEGHASRSRRVWSETVAS